MTTFLDLQNSFYNALVEGLGLQGNFQIIQPSPPLLQGGGANGNGNLWNYFDNIPPESLTQNYISSGGNQFYSDYKGLLSALQGQPNNFVADVGPACNSAWNQYIQTLPLSTGLNQYPGIFKHWAISHGFITVANKGANDLAQILLDPVSAANLAIQPYLGDSTAIPPIPSKPADWNLGYADLVRQLHSAPSKSITTGSSHWSSNVANTWTSGSNSGFFGLWGGSSSTSTQSATYAGGSFTMTASFKNVLLFSAVPGAWYDSATMGLAFSHKTGAPWVANAAITWANTFDPTHGNLNRFTVNLVVVNKMHISVTSSAVFSHADQTTINNNSGGGLWPFYSSNSSSGVTTKHSFNNQGHMTTTTDSVDGVPVVIGCTVLPIGQFV
jgi:hypothetical protein